MSRIRMSSPWITYLVRLADGASIFLAGLLALNVRQILNLPVEFPRDLSNYYSVISATSFAFSVLPGEVYRSWRSAQIPAMLAKVTGRWAMLIGILLLWLFVYKSSQEFSRIWFMLWSVGAIILLWLERIGVYLCLRELRRRGFNLRHVLLVGSGPAVDSLKQRLVNSGWSGYNISATVPAKDLLNLEKHENLDVSEIWLALSLGDEVLIKDVLHALRHSTASIRFVPDLFTLRLINHGMTDVLGMPMYDLSTSPMTGMNQLIKWLEDKILAIFILLLVSPVMIILAIGVKVTSPGPIFYRQERVGLNNKPFNMLKFRSMPVDTEKLSVQWGGSAAKATTKFGKSIRRTSLDELPQFLNVLKGDMSIVGPRPERTIFVEKFKEEIPDYMKKHMVKAGITGWAQVNGWRGDTDLKTRIEYDLYYIDHWSLWLDLKIIVMTIFKGIVNKNAR